MLFPLLFLFLLSVSLFSVCGVVHLLGHPPELVVVASICPMLVSLVVLGGNFGLVVAASRRRSRSHG